MILVWKDMTSFCRHLHDMRVFWQLHQKNPRYRWNKVRDMPAMNEMRLRGNAGGANRFYSSNGKAIVVPIWKITPPRGIQN
jgi:predicted RNA-binding protein with PUA-like domain